MTTRRSHPLHAVVETSARRRRIAPLLLWIGLCLAAALPAAADGIRAYLFWQEGCPYCERAKVALRGIAAESPDVEIVEIELGVSAEADRLFGWTVGHFGVERPGVPFVVMGEQVAVGYASGGRSDGLYREMIRTCRAGPCPDRVAELGGGAQAPPVQDTPGAVETVAVPETVSLPLIGQVELTALSLPLLTVVLAAIDGFNPCAMWVLALLIGMLLGVQDSRRMWTLGAVFLLATAVMYYGVMAAWLNVVLWIGAVGWLRLAIGALAVGAGLYYLHDYWTNPEGVCKVTPGQRKKSIADALRRVVETPNLVVASLSIAALAVAVNLIELVCSAGVPAIYTQMLAMQDLSPAAHYGYLALYLAVFLLDDTVIFVVAMVTLRSVASSGRYARLSHLIGGVVLMALGAVMILRPDLLS